MKLHNQYTKAEGPAVAEDRTFVAKDFSNGSPVKWCPGCGDYAVLSSLQKAMAEIGVAPEDIAVISGIGCSSRLPYYMNTYGMHTIHGRAAAIATGVKVANPNLSVWIMSGDGDSLAIGGNHFIHLIRRNVDLNLVLFNNRIYGLTKGQYSPTSPRGFKSKSSPFGTVEDPFIPGELVFGARGTFFARSLEVEMELLKECMVAAHNHRGTSVVEAMTNCVIFNNGIHKVYSDREVRADKTIILRHGEKMVYGKDKNKGLVLDGLTLKSITIGEDGYTLDDVLVHDAHTPSPVLHSMLAMMHEMDGNLPLAMGVIRDVDGPAYDLEVARQMETEVEKLPEGHSFQNYLGGLAGWDVKGKTRS